MLKVDSAYRRICLVFAVLLLSQELVAAIFHPNGDVSNLINDIISANESLAYDIIDLGGHIYILGDSYAGNSPADGCTALPEIASGHGKLSIINGSIYRVANE